jgi:hypothetical protein
MPRGRKGQAGASGAGRVVRVERAMAALERQADEWEARAAAMRAAVEALRGELREAGRAARGATAGARRGPGRPAGGKRPARARAPRPRGEGAGSAAAEILREWGRPARVGELLPELERRGVRVGGKNPRATLNSTLLKYEGVKKAGRGLFVVKR